MIASIRTPGGSPALSRSAATRVATTTAQAAVRAGRIVRMRATANPASRAAASRATVAQTDPT